jgi:hypothetical protein
VAGPGRRQRGSRDGCQCAVPVGIADLRLDSESELVREPRAGSSFKLMIMTEARLPGMMIRVMGRRRLELAALKINFPSGRLGHVI